MSNFKTKNVIVKGQAFLLTEPSVAAVRPAMAMLEKEDYTGFQDAMLEVVAGTTANDIGISVYNGLIQEVMDFMNVLKE